MKAFVASGQLGFFANAYWGNPGYKLPPEINLLGVTHYLESLDFQREIVKVHAIVGGKNPHPNYLVGGVPCPINMSDTGAQGIMINQVWMNFLRDVAKSTIRFIDEVYYPDLMAMQAYYKDWYKIGGGLANKNLLCYGDFPAYANDMSEKSLVMPNGAVIDGKFDQILPVDLKDPNQIKEFVDHSWYSYPKPDEGLHPWEGITDPNFDLGKAGVDYEGTKTDIEVIVDDNNPIHGVVGCDRYYARAVKGFDPASHTPNWMRRRLTRAGMRSISLAVDVTNYVMLDLGQPMHAYDLDKIEGPIVVRRANEGEKLTTLDGKDHDLSVEDLLITDSPNGERGSRVLGIAGVMGGLYGEVTAETRTSCWNPLISTRCRSRVLHVVTRFRPKRPVVSSVAWMISCSRLPPRWPPSFWSSMATASRASTRLITTLSAIVVRFCSRRPKWPAWRDWTLT